MRGNSSLRIANLHHSSTVRYLYQRISPKPIRASSYAQRPLPAAIVTLRTPPFQNTPAASLHTTYRMASDEDYQSFLDRANLDPGTGTSTPTSRPVVSKAVNTDIPKELLEVQEYYVSEADEPFKPVSLIWKRGSMPADDEFAELIDSNYEVTGITQKEFDPKGQYKNVITAVENAGDGEASIFRTQFDKTRLEYFVVSLDKNAHRIVGLKAIAVES